MDQVGQRLLKVAQGQLGYSEHASGYTKFGDWYYRNVDHSDSYFKTAPWCDMFVAWAAHQAGADKSVGEFAYTPDHARWYRKHHAWGHTPEPGAVVFFSWSGGHAMDDVDHVGIVERVSGHTLHTIEGNVQGGVLLRKTRYTGQVVGYGYPAKVKVAQPHHPSPRTPAVTEIRSRPDDARQGAPIDQEAVLGGLLGVVVLGTVALAVGKAMVPEQSPIRLRKRGRHHRTRVRTAPIDVMWDTLADLEQDQDLAFWDVLHTELTAAVGPPPLSGRGGGAAVLPRLATGARAVTVTFADQTGHPAWITGRDGLTWRVLDTLDWWEHPDAAKYGWAPGYRAETERWQLTVVGPLPGRPDLHGEQNVTLRAVGDSWQLAPG